MSYTKGIDVSQWNGSVDWERVKASGVEFAMLRAGYGRGNPDRRFARNAEECTRLGIPFGVYWFSYALTPEDAAREAAACIDAIKGYRLSYPVAFDFEYDSVENAEGHGVEVTKALASRIVRAFCGAVRRAGYAPMNYANPDFLSRYFEPELRREYPLWLARWPDAEPDLNSERGEAVVWQYSSRGSVPGIEGQVDMDVSYLDNEPAPGRDGASEWAVEATEYCVRKGIFVGGADGYNWQGSLTREQAAQLIYTILEKLDMLDSLPDA